MRNKKEKAGTGGQGFLQGALVLTAAMAVVKVIGALFKIPLNYTVGEYGMGLFNVAYHFYGPVFSLATAGFPAAVSRMVSESVSLGRWNQVHQVRRTALPLFLTFGILGMVCMTLLAPLYCRIMIGSVYALAPVLALAPAILFAAWSSVYRGYYAGLKTMTPTAVSEVAEAVVKLSLGLWLSRWVVGRCTREYADFGTVFSMSPGSSDEAAFLTLSFGAAAAVLGVTAGAAASVLVLKWEYRRRGEGFDRALLKKAPPADSFWITAKRLTAITLPIAVGSITANVAGLLDATFLQKQLSRVLEREPERLLACFAGMIPEIYRENLTALPTFLYGCYTLAMTVYLLVPALTQAIGVSALPMVTEAWAKGNREQLRDRISSVCRLTALFCFPAGLGLSAVAGPAVQTLYGDSCSWPIVAGVLAPLGIASLAAALTTPLASMLQAVGRADLPVKWLLGAMGIKLGVNWLLCGLPEVNLCGAAAGTFACYLFLAAGELHSLNRHAKVALRFRSLFLCPLVCSAFCGVSARVCCLSLGRWGLQPPIILAVSVAFGACMYLLALFLVGGIEESDLKVLPKGQKIAKMLEKRD